MPPVLDLLLLKTLVRPTIEGPNEPAECQTDDWPKHKNTCDYMTSANSLIEQARGMASLDDAALFLTKKGGEYADMGKIEAARVLYQEALTVARGIQGKYQPTLATVYCMVGQFFREQGQYAEALHSFTEEYDITLRDLGKDHPLVTACLESMGIMHGALHNFEQAWTLQLAVVNALEGKPGTATADLAMAYSNAATSAAILGKTTEALFYQRKALALYQSAPTGDVDGVARSHMTIGSMLVQTGLPTEAVGEFEKALRDRRERLGGSHPDVGETLAGLAQALKAQGKTEEAQQRGAEALRIVEAALGANHPDTVSVRKRCG